MVTFLLNIPIKSLESHLGFLSSDTQKCWKCFISSRRSIPDPHPDSLLCSSQVLHTKSTWDSQFTMLQLFEHTTVPSKGPGQVLLFTTSPRSTCAESILCLTTAIPLALLSCWYACLTNKDEWEVYQE